MNTVILSGYISWGPELRRTESGKAVCSFKLAVRRSREGTDFLPITCWESTAEFVTRNFHKGSRVEVTAKLRQNTWTDSDGSKHYDTAIVASSVDFGERAPKTAEVGNAEVPAADTDFYELPDEDVSGLPF